MKKRIAFGVGIFITNLLCSCENNQKLVDMKSVVSDGHMSIIWADRIYVPLCVVSKSDCGAQIGYIDGDEDDRVYEYKEYSQAKWTAIGI